MISTLSMRLPCKDCKPDDPLMPTSVDGFPSIKMRTFSLPRKLIPPSPLTCTDGKLPNISAAVAPLLAASVPTLNTRLSKASSILAFCPLTVTSAKVCVLAFTWICPSAVDLLIWTCLSVCASNPTLSMMISYIPCVTSILNSPLSFAIAPVINFTGLAV